MNNLEMKKKILALIEELNPESTYLTDDPDITAKINEVINQIMFELARIKKIPKYVEMDVTAGQLLTFESIGSKCGYEVYQIARICGVGYDSKADGTVMKVHEDGTAEIDVFVYPERITEKTKDNAYEFELSQDALEIMPYGVAGDLLKSDVSAQYGTIYYNRYQEMLQRLDPRYQLPMFSVEGGVMI